MAHTGYPRTIADLGPGDHLCCIYETEEEHQAVLMPFLRQGLERGEKVLYIVDAYTAETGPGVFGVFDLDGMIACCRPRRSGPWSRATPPLRATGEMVWVLRGLSGPARLSSTKSQPRASVQRCCRRC